MSLTFSFSYHINPWNIEFNFQNLLPSILPISPMISSGIKERKKGEGEQKRGRSEEEPGHEKSKKKGGEKKEEASLTVVEVPRHLDALRSRGKFERSSVWTRVRHYVGIWGAQAARVHACAPPSDARVHVCAAIRACWEEELYTRCPPCAAINYRVTRYGRARPTLYREKPVAAAILKADFYTLFVSRAAAVVGSGRITRRPFVDQTFHPTCIRERRYVCGNINSFREILVDRRYIYIYVIEACYA